MFEIFEQGDFGLDGGEMDLGRKRDLFDGDSFSGCPIEGPVDLAKGTFSEGVAELLEEVSRALGKRWGAHIIM